MKPLILIADNDQEVSRRVCSSFSTEGFEAISIPDVASALDETRAKSPSLVVLGVNTPGDEGLAMLRALRADRQTANVPVIVVSACTDTVSRICGLELGADDYVSKPFSLRELVLRGRAILQRTNAEPAQTPVLICGAITLDEDRRAALINGERTDLTAIEFKLLMLLARSAGRVLARTTLLSTIWGADTDVDLRTVDTHVRRLRDKLGPARDQVQTVRGFGYRLESEGATAA
jgi:two-component system phosphate regulon response regulator PhoB